jgi:hypothetical protein
VHVNEKSIAPHEEILLETPPGDDTRRLADKNVRIENEITVADTDNEAHTHDVAFSSVNQAKTGEIAADDSAGQQCPTQSYNEGVSELLQVNDMGRRLGRLRKREKEKKAKQIPLLSMMPPTRSLPQSPHQFSRLATWRKGSEAARSAEAQQHSKFYDADGFELV